MVPDLTPPQADSTWQVGQNWSVAVIAQKEPNIDIIYSYIDEADRSD